MYWISLSILPPAGMNAPPFTISDLEVGGLAVRPDADVLIGTDVLLQCQLHLDGPARQFTLYF